MCPATYIRSLSVRSDNTSGLFPKGTTSKLKLTYKNQRLINTMWGSTSSTNGSNTRGEPGRARRTALSLLRALERRSRDFKRLSLGGYGGLRYIKSIWVERPHPGDHIPGVHIPPGAAYSRGAIRKRGILRRKWPHEKSIDSQ